MKSAKKKGGLPFSKPSSFAASFDSTKEEAENADDTNADETIGVHRDKLHDAPLPATYINLPTEMGYKRIRAYRIEEYEVAMPDEPCVIYSATKPPVAPEGGDFDSPPREVFSCKREQIGASLERIREDGGAVVYLGPQGHSSALEGEAAAYILHMEIMIREMKHSVDKTYDVAATAAALMDGPNQTGVKAAEDGYCFGRQSVEDAIAAVARGELIVVVDDESRENEGDFIMAADKCTPEAMGEFIRYSSGVICIGMEGKRMDELELPPMVVNNEDPKGTAFSVSVDATSKHGITTGISAADRAKTSVMLAKKGSKASDFHRPGHIFPLRAKDNGVLSRDGHTEAAVDFSRLAGSTPAGLLCEIVSEEDPTEMARLPELKRFCRRHGYVLTSIADLQQYRRDTGL